MSDMSRPLVTRTWPLELSAHSLQDYGTAQLVCMPNVPAPVGQSWLQMVLGLLRFRLVDLEETRGKDSVCSCIVCRYGLSHHLEPPNPVSSAHCAILRNCVSRISDLGDLLIVFVALRVAERTSQSVAECQDIERCPQLSELKVKSSERATKQ